MTGSARAKTQYWATFGFIEQDWGMQGDIRPNYWRN